ncbi:hypothetical protein [Thalassospira sp. B30-1]|jgi:hypothetical protein|uniref:hypothetical protein n=1 Tax=Thalassospira sp. B30-1 TaxID=2785911 RepID=UPI0018CBCFE5|nr:hypothetical protein [Thalassospira sp. B30-1]QPL37260.1 hypothetical protein IT971_08225 [Thalassospira sp. B30-1]
MEHSIRIDMVDRVTPVVALLEQFPESLVHLSHFPCEVAFNLDVLPAGRATDRTLVAEFSEGFLEALAASGTVDVDLLIAKGILHKDFSRCGCGGDSVRDGEGPVNK